MDKRDGGLSAGSEDGVLAGFKFADARGEFKSGGRAVEAVGVADFVLVPGVLNASCGGEDGRGAAIGGRGERFVARGNFGVGVDEFGLPGFGHGDSRAPKWPVGRASEVLRNYSEERDFELLASRAIR